VLGVGLTDSLANLFPFRRWLNDIDAYGLFLSLIYTFSSPLALSALHHFSLVVERHLVLLLARFAHEPRNSIVSR